MKVILALCMRNIKAFVRNKAQLISSFLFPFFFIFVFSAIFKNEFIENPETYMLAGIVISTVFDFSLRISSSTIDDMTSGFMKEVLVSPVSRFSIASGQFLSSAVIGTLQGIVIIAIGYFIGFRVSTPLTIVYAVFAMFFVGIVFSGFGLFLATSAKNIQTFQVISMVITMPMTFISGAYIPFNKLPDFLMYIGYINPMTYAVAFFRSVTLEKMNLSAEELIKQELMFQIGGFQITPLVSMLILAAFGLLFLFLATSSFIRLDFSRINRNKNDAIEW